MKTMSWVAALALTTAGWAAENATAPPSTPSPSPNGVSWERASAPTISSPRPARPITAPVARASGARSGIEAGVWPGAKPVALKEGEATLLIGGSALTLRPGSLVGSDAVKSIGSDRIVLVRGATTANPGGAATVVVSFDATGQSRVRVYWLSDPAATVPREVR